MLEIRELVVKVTVMDDSDRPKSNEVLDKNELINACVKRVLQKLDRRKRR